MKDPQDRVFDPEWMKNLDRSQLRYFSGSEIARLFGFPETKFSFPTNTSLKQQWKLMGNSINCRLSSRVILIGLIVLLCEQDENAEEDREQVGQNEIPNAEPQSSNSSKGTSKNLFAQNVEEEGEN